MYGKDRLDNLMPIEIGLAISLALFLLYGEGDYKSVTATSGPYEVGFREFTTKELWNDCSVYYPVDKIVSDKFKSEGFGSVHLLRYPKSLSGLKNALSSIDGLAAGLNKFRVKFYTFVSVPAAMKAPLADDFAQGKKKLQPLVFSHAEAADRMVYSTMLRELASHGFLVVALNHNDQTCMHTLGRPKDQMEEEEEETKSKIMGDASGPIKQETKPKNSKSTVNEDDSKKERAMIKFDKNKVVTNIEYTKLQLSIREAELDSLMTEVRSETFLSKRLGFTVDAKAALDLDRLVVMGH